MRNHIISLLVLLLFMSFAPVRSAATVQERDSTILDFIRDEKVNVKTNLLYDLGAGINLGVELPLSPKTSFDISAVYNPFTFADGVKWKNWIVQPEFRFWTRRRFNGHFFSAHILGGEYNINAVPLLYNIYPETRTHRFEGWGIGAGIGYGYRWTFNSRWAMEGQIAVGAIYSRYSKYRCGHCGERLAKGNKAYVGPTKLALSLIYRFGARDIKPAAIPSLLPPEKIILRDTILLRDTVWMAPLPADTIETGTRMRHASHALRLVFSLDNTVIDPLLNGNAAEIDSLTRFIDRYTDDPTLRVSRIEIEAYASVEGKAAHNLELSEKRARAGAELISDLRPDLEPLISWRGMGEDWESPDFPGKETIMAEPDLDRREQRLRELAGGSIFRSLLLTQLPRNRRLECVIYFTTIEQYREIKSATSQTNQQ